MTSVLLVLYHIELTVLHYCTVLVCTALTSWGSVKSGRVWRVREQRMESRESRPLVASTAQG